MLTPIIGWFVAQGMSERAAKLAAVVAAAIAAIALIGALWGAWQAFDWFNDRDAVRDAAHEANSNFVERKDKAAGAADIESTARHSELEAKVKRTKDLIDEALARNCAVAEYLASGGAMCLRPNPGIPRSQT